MIQVVQVGTYSVIGEWDAITKTMLAPRVMQTRQVSPTETRLIMAVMIGNPKAVAIHEPLMSYEPDKEVQDYYRSEVTGIKLVPTGVIGGLRP